MTPRRKALLAAGLPLLLLLGPCIWLCTQRTKASVDAPAAGSDHPPPAGAQRTAAWRAAPLSRAPVARGGSPAEPAAPHADRGAPPFADAPRAEGSLRGTDVDGFLAADDAGHLVPGPGVRHFFDYFLTTEGEESAQALRARVLAHAAARLPEPAAGELARLYDQYLDYRDQSRGLRGGGGGNRAPADAREAHARLRDLRREVLGPGAAAALFSDVDPIDDGAPDEALPPAVRAARATATLPSRLDAEEAAMRAAGATDAELHSARVQASGPDGAARLHALDEARRSFDERLRRLDAQQRALEAEEPDADARARKRSVLVDALFTPQEQRRLAAARVLAAAGR